MKRLVVLNFFPAFSPPKSGGELRLHNLYAALSRRFRVDLVSWTYEDAPLESIRLTKTFTDHRVPKGNGHRDSYACFERLGITGEAAGVSCALAGRGDSAYHRVAARLIAKADAVIHEFPYTLDYDRTIETDGKPRLYNSHNVEADMARSLTGTRAIHDLVYGLERRLAERAALIFATSEQERLKFHCLYGVPLDRIALCPNGIAEEEFAWADDAIRARERNVSTRLNALFLGSDHPPNVQAARYIATVLAPSFPGTDFIIAGSVCARLDGAMPSNLVLRGKLDAEAKDAAFARADLFLNPIAQGAGTSLKALEAMAAGLPVLSTELGIRGLDLKDGRDVAVASLERFPSRLVTLLARPLLRAELGLAARATVHKHFEWSAIAEKTGAAIEALLDRKAPPPPKPPRMVLWANDFSIANPVAGGALRNHRLMSQVAHDSDVILLCFGHGMTVEIEALAPRLYEIRIPRTPDHAALIERVNQGHGVSVDDLVAALACTYNPDLVFLFGRLATRAVTVVFSQPYLLPLLQLNGKTGRVVLDMHNVEAPMKAALLHHHRDADLLVPLVESLEAYGCAEADAVTAVSDEDAALIAELYGVPSTVIGNGADLCPAKPLAAATAARATRDWDKAWTAIFIGSGHPPNVPAARFLCERMLPALPKMRLRIVGTVCDALGDLAGRDRLELLGRVSDAQKRSLLLEADVALNPVTEGGGSNLKIADYLSHGLPIVTTPFGARGFALEGAAEIVDLDDFPAACTRLAVAPAARKTMARTGRALAARDLSWKTLGERFAALAAPAAASAPPLRVLVVTYRYTEPTLGGAEEYLAKLLHALEATGDVVIDLMAPSVGAIFNQSRFISRSVAQPASSAGVFAPFLRQVMLFPPDEPKQSAETASCWRVLHMWQAESLTLGRMVAQHIDAPLLLGGWNAPESHKTGMRRWSSGVSEIFLPAGYTTLRLIGFHESEGATLKCRLDGKIVATLRPKKRFTIELPLDTSSGQILQLAMTPHHAEGVLIEIAFALTGATLSGGGKRAIDLTEDYESVASSRLTGSWIDWAVEVASARDPKVEADFQALRGPHSRALMDTLRRSAGDYDVVLVQGVPFGQSAEAADVAHAAGVPVVVLPHFHVEDRFYHWREYYRLFGSASGVLTFSAGPTEDLVVRMGGKPVRIPGGGIDPVEFANRTQAERAFRWLHTSPRPYVLVLGRKSGSKRCDLVVEAWQSVRDTLDLVFIGADEGADIPAASGVYNYGLLPRGAVVGALSGCFALATMSESESFGMVLLEAWTTGRPVIANAGTLAFAELVADGEDGILVRDAAELAAAMRRLFADPEAAARMGERGRAKAERYTWRNLSATLGDTLRRAAAQRRSATRPRRQAGRKINPS